MPHTSVPVLGVPEASPVAVVPYEAMPSTLQEELAPRVRRLGYLGGFFGLAAHQPDALLHFTRFTETLKAALPEGLSDLVALAAAAGNPYEVVQHIRLARTHGRPDSWIRAVTEGRPGGDMNPGEQEVLALVLTVRDGANAGAQLRAVVARLGEPAAVAILLLLGRYVAHGLVSHALGLGPPVPLDPPL